MFNPKALRPFVMNWAEVAAGLLQRVQREAVSHVIDAKTVELLEALKEYPDVRRLGTVKRTLSPVVPIHFAKGKERWSYFSLITTVGTPQSITAQELRLECMFPTDSGKAGDGNMRTLRPR